MFNYIVFRWKLWLLERKREHIHTAIAKLAVTDEEKEKQQTVLLSEIVSLTDDLHWLHHDYLWKKSARLMISIPDGRDEENWEDSASGAFRRPSKKAINEMRAAIRAEKKARMDLLVMWLPSVIGIIGALTGLAAVLIGMRK